MKLLLVVLAAVLGLVVAGLAAWSARSDESTPTVSRAAAVTPERVAQAVTTRGLVHHLRELQAIAGQSGDTRAAGTEGYDRSAEYVLATLRAAGYDPRVQRFSVRASREVRPTRLERVAPEPGRLRRGRDFVLLDYSGSGRVTAPVVPVDAAGTTSGCEDSDFADFPDGAIALMRRGGCFFVVKAENGEAAGAAAALVFNEGGSGRESPISATLVRPAVDIPVLGLSNDLGEELATGTAASLRVTAEVDNSALPTANVIADLPGRGGDGFVLLGAHLDSVAAGPGINDNGSGVATVLEAAVQLRRLRARPERGIRFAFWAAEELGLKGSLAYAGSLDDSDEIAAVLNFDMVGSPNYARLVYESEDSIEGAFEDWFAEHELPVETIALAGRSDHAPFADLGIPTGGLFTGADEPKTPAEERLFGGEAGEAHDACYHQACDTLANVDRAVLAQMADAAAAVALELASS